MQQEDPDLALINAVLSGRLSAYTELVRRHQRFVFTLALRFTKNREDAEEVAQDCFIKAYRALGTFRQTSKFSTWLYTITYTSAMTTLRKKKLNVMSLDDQENGISLTSHIASQEKDPTERKFSHHYLNQAIERLPAEDAAILTLFYKGEQSLEEISQLLHIEPGTIKVKLHRARLKLKEKLNYLLKDEVKELI